MTKVRQLAMMKVSAVDTMLMPVVMLQFVRLSAAVTGGHDVEGEPKMLILEEKIK